MAGVARAAACRVRLLVNRCGFVKQVFDEPEKTYMVMELLTGGNVMDRIVELDHCSEQLTSHVVKQVTRLASPVLHLHSLLLLSLPFGLSPLPLPSFCL